MATSFISERSAEYYLIPYLKRELEKYYKCVAPVFPWLNRETSKVSKLMHGSDRFQLLIVFPRRSKIDTKSIKNIYITINSELFEFKDFADQNNIPVIAGCPIATDFWSLSRCNDFVWIEINDQIPDSYLNLIHDSSSSDSVIPNISVDYIVNMVNESESIDINQLLEFLENSKHMLPRNFLFGPRYKPVYFLIKSH